MKHAYKAFSGALLILGLAGVFIPEPASAGYYWDSVCNCRRPDHEFNTRRYVREAPSVRTRERFEERTRVVRGNTRLEQENRLVVHVKPVINREVVVRRVNTIVKDVVLHKVNTTHRSQVEHRNEVAHREVQGSVRHVVEHRNVRGVDCNCDGRSYRTDRVSYRY